MATALKKPGVAVGAAAAVAEALLEQRRPTVARRLTPRERRVEGVGACLLIATAAVMGLAASSHGDASTAVLLTLLYALARRVRFPLGPGLIRPTQVVFVPMLFLTPAAAVPALVVLGSLIGELPDAIRKDAHPERLLVAITDGWYAVGPALVIAGLAGGAADDASWGLLGLALAAQASSDLAASMLREGLGAGISPADLLPVLALVFLVDALLTPIGYLAVLASEVHERAYLLAIAPGILLGLIARERSERIAHELALERAFRRSTRALDARAEALHRQAESLESSQRGTGERGTALERVLLATAIEAVHADRGRLSALAPDGGLLERVETGQDDGSLQCAEQSLGAPCCQSLAIAVGHSHLLAVSRAARRFSALERDLLEHLAAQAAVSLENHRLEELMQRTEAELRALADAAGESQRFLTESSRTLADSRDPETTLPAVARLVAETMADACEIHLLEDGELRLAARAGRADPAQSGVAVPIPMRDRVAGQITFFGGRVDAAVAEDLALRVAVAVDNAQLRRMRAAIIQTLQHSLLPPELPRIRGIQTAAHFRPAGEGDEVGGDFYDLFPTDDREWFAVMGDAGGKGAEAASVAALARDTIRAAVPRHRSPAGILRRVNDALLHRRAGRSVTVALARLQLAGDGTITVTVAGGGHPSPRIRHSSSGLVQSLGEPGTLLGAVAEVDLFDRSTRLESGDALVLFTDGLSELSVPRVWTPAHLDAVVGDARSLDAQAIVDHLAARAAAEAGGPLRDDLALLALRVQPLL